MFGQLIFLSQEQNNSIKWLYIEEEKTFHQHNLRKKPDRSGMKKHRKTETKFMIHDLKIKCIRNIGTMFFGIRFKDLLSWIRSGIWCQIRIRSHNTSREWILHEYYKHTSYKLKSIQIAQVILDSLTAGKSTKYFIHVASNFSKNEWWAYGIACRTIDNSFAQSKNFKPNFTQRKSIYRNNFGT